MAADGQTDHTGAVRRSGMLDGEEDAMKTKTKLKAGDGRTTSSTVNAMQLDGYYTF